MTDDEFDRMFPKPECIDGKCVDLGYDDQANKYIKKYGYKNLIKETLEKIQVGKHNHVPDSSFNKWQLRRGVEVEKEHTDDPNISKKIAKDHLSELSDYYTRLDKMEKEGDLHFKNKMK